VEKKTNETFTQLLGGGGGFKPHQLMQQQINPHHTVGFSGHEAKIYYLSDQHRAFIVEAGSDTD
jgi:hypothetical protein